MTISNRHSCISKYIKNALLGEVFTTPKPGLVDLWDSGAHRDMNWLTFVKSTDAITPYLAQMYEAGERFYRYQQTKPQKTVPMENLFLMIRETGKKAEKAMYQATGGINTHKGMLFSMGILCAAYGYCYAYCCQEVHQKHRPQEENVRVPAAMIFETAGRMTGKILKNEIRDLKRQMPETNGEYLLWNEGIRGVRGEVLDGFPVVRESAYPKLADAMKQKACNPAIDQNQINLQILLFIMKDLCDTNVLSRGHKEGLLWIQQEAETVLQLGGAFKEEGIDRLLYMNQECIRRNISSGGAADQLALTLLLWQMENQKEIPVYIPKVYR